MSYKKFLMRIIFVCLIISNLVINVEAKNIIRIGFRPFKNFIEVDENGNKYGYGYEYLKALEQEGNLEIELTKGNYEELIELQKQGKIDLIMLTRKSRSLEEEYEFSARDIGYSKGIIYTNKETDLYYEDYKNFDKKRVGFFCQSLMVDFKKYANNKNFGYSSKKYNTLKECEKAIENNEVDIIISGVMRNSEHLKVVGYFQAKPLYVLALKGNETIKKFSETQNKLHVNEPMLDSQLVKKYYSKIYSDNTQLTRDEAKFLETKPEYRVAILPNRFSLSVFDVKKDKFIGVQPDLIKKISEISGIKLNIVETKKDENLLTSIEKGIVDMSMGMQKSKLFLENPNLTFCKEITPMQWSFVYSSNRKVNFEGTEKVGVLTKFLAVKEFIKKNYPNWEIIEYDTPEECFEDIKKEKILCTPISNFYALYYLQNPRYYDLKIYPQAAMQNSINLVLSSNLDPRVKTILDKAISKIDNKMVDNMIRENITKTYYEVDFKTWLYLNFYYILVVGIFFAILIGGFLLHTKKMKSKNKELEKASLAKTEFMARMSHDMRTPLGAIIGMADFGVMESKNENELRYFKQIKESSEYLLELVNDILDKQMLEKGYFKLDKKSYKVNELLNNTKQIVKLKASMKSIKIDIIEDKTGEDYYIKIDKRKMEQILINIINNAIKYTKKSGYVKWEYKFYVHKNEINIVHRITDNGIGITEKFQKKMFEAFTQGKNCYSSSECGVGLGLYIAKKFTELMGATIKCKSEIGKGTEFIIIFKYKIEKENNKESINEIQIDFLEGKRILVCEDIEINAKIIEKILKIYKIKMKWAKDGKKGVELAKNNEFDAILMDIRMPKLNGIEATEEIRKFNKNIPIIAVSANAYKKDIEKSLYAGMNAHIEKPIDKEKLIKTIVELLK